MIPDAGGLGIAVVTNASAFIAAGHMGQYDLSLGLAHLLVGRELPPDTAGPLLTLVVPLLSWALVAAIVGLALRFVRRNRRDTATGRSSRPERSWRQTVLCAAGYLTLGIAPALMLPLGTVRHFYPDVGWALTALAYLATTWAIARTALIGMTHRRATDPARSHQAAERTHANNDERGHAHP